MRRTTGCILFLFLLCMALAACGGSPTISTNYSGTIALNTTMTQMSTVSLQFQNVKEDSKQNLTRTIVLSGYPPHAFYGDIHQDQTLLLFTLIPGLGAMDFTGSVHSDNS